MRRRATPRDAIVGTGGQVEGGEGVEELVCRPGPAGEILATDVHGNGPGRHRVITEADDAQTSTTTGCRSARTEIPICAAACRVVLNCSPC